MRLQIQRVARRAPSDDWLNALSRTACPASVSHESSGGPIRQIVFLVGGRGTPSGDFIAKTLKPMLEIAPGLCILDVLVEDVARHGFSDTFLLAGHRGAIVEDAYLVERLGRR